MENELLMQILTELKELKMEQAATNARLDTIDQRLSNLEEDSKVTRASVNTLLEWAEEAQVQVKIPLFKKAE